MAGLSASAATDLLMLAMNCNNPATAEAAVDHLPEQLEEGTARQLLLIATARQHKGAVTQMIQLPRVEQHVTAATLETVFRQMLAHDVPVMYLWPAPAAAQLSSEAAVRLLAEAIKQRGASAIEVLVTLAGATQMSSRQAMGLLEECLETSTYTDTRYTTSACLLRLCRLPAAKALSSDDLVQLLQAVIKRGPCMDFSADPRFDGQAVMTRSLLRLPAAADLSSSQMVQLLSVAALHNSNLCLSTLCGLSIAASLSIQLLLQPLQHAVACGSGECTSALVRLLPSVQQLSVEALAQLLQAATDRMSVHCLCKLPAVMQLTTRQLSDAQQMYLSRGSKDCILVLHRLLAARGMLVGQLAELA